MAEKTEADMSKESDTSEPSAPSAGRKRRRDMAKLAIEVFSIATALSFIVSAILHEIVFAIWGIDFTSVASVEDVVMGGIRLLVTSVFIGSFVAYIAVILAVIISELGMKIWEQPVRRVVYVLLVIGLLIATTKAAESVSGRIVSGLERVLDSTIFFGIIFLFIAAIISTSRVPMNKVYSNVARFWKWIGIAAAAPIILFTIMVIGSGYGNLQVENKGTLPATCARFHRVLWIGSRSLILKCHETIMVLRSDAVLPLRVAEPRSPDYDLPLLKGKSTRPRAN